MKAIFVSLGCDKNTVDSEKIFIRYVKKYNLDICVKPEDADIVIINTCSFIHDAKKESIETILYFAKLKKQGIIKKILVLGCLVAENKRTHEFDNIFANVDVAVSIDEYINDLYDMNDRAMDVLSFSSSLKICDGCDKYCSYCIIPYLRGHFKSALKDSIVKEVKLLAKNGTREVSIVGQDILRYGKDIELYKDEERPIVSLIDAISKVDGIKWIRLLYCYPEEIDDNIIQMIKTNKKVLHYIDMPIQHISNKILKAMNRKTTKENIVRLITKLRKEIEDICIRTTLIVGFPGEDKNDFDELLDFVKEIQFDKLGVFTYSREKLSKSYNLPNQVPDEVKKERQKIMLNTQKDIVNLKNEKRCGKIYEAIVEGKDTKNSCYIVRPYFNARDIDDKVYLRTDKQLISGDFVKIQIKSSNGYDLIGELV